MYAAAERFPGLVPTRDEVAVERERKLPDKQGIEIAQGLFLSYVLASPRCGAHLVWSMLRPTEAALERLDEFRATGVADLGGTYLERRGRVAYLEIRNDRHLNAEDCDTLPTTETAVDLALLDPDVEVGVIRGAVVSHPRYAGRRVFGAGPQPHAPLSRPARLHVLRHARPRLREQALPRAQLRGVPPGRAGADDGEALGRRGRDVRDRRRLPDPAHGRSRDRDARNAALSPARKEGILPGASNLRLARSVGDRLARQAILSGLEFEAGTPHGDLLCDEVVESSAEMDAAIAERVEALTSSGLVNAAGNRRALRVGAEPLDTFRQYMATFCREQAYCHFSPALVRNLEEHWNAHERRL